MKVTTRKLAETAGVSPASVSRYLNGSEKVSDGIATRIQAAMEQLDGTAPNAKDRRKVVLLLLSHLRFAFYQQATALLLEQKRDSDVDLVLLRYESCAPAQIKRLASRLRPIGVLYLEEEMDPAVLRMFQESGIRTIMCGGAAPDAGSDMVRVNDIAAAYDGTNYLLDLGHRKLLILSDETRKIGAGFQRVTGSRKAVEERGLVWEEDAVICCGVTYEAGYAATLEALTQGREFTAVFAYSDELAAGAMAALYDSGRAVPGDVSVLGYDDLPLAAKLRPALTTIRQPMEGFVQKALELLGNPADTPPEEILLRHSIVERGSCRRLY